MNSVRAEVGLISLITEQCFTVAPSQEARGLSRGQSGSCGYSSSPNTKQGRKGTNGPYHSFSVTMYTDEGGERFTEHTREQPTPR
jgi:hypothetical protein